MIQPLFLFQQGKVTEIGSTKKKRTFVSLYEIPDEGFIVELTGYHFYNSEEKVRSSEHGQDFVAKRLLAELIDGEVKLLDSKGQIQNYKPTDFGIFYPTLVSNSLPVPKTITNPNFGREGRTKSSEEKTDTKEDTGSNEEGSDTKEGEGSATKEIAKEFIVRKYDFVVQMVFIPTSAAERDVARTERLEAELEDEAEAAKQAGENSDASSGDTPEDSGATEG